MKLLFVSSDVMEFPGLLRRCRQARKRSALCRFAEKRAGRTTGPPNTWRFPGKMLGLEYQVDQIRLSRLELAACR
jgi:hypothetical protein